MEENKFSILSSNYNQDNSLNIRVHSEEKPSREFMQATPQLDDVYFMALQQDEPVLTSQGV